MRLIDKVNNYVLNPHIIGSRNRTAFYPSEASVISRTDGKIIGKCQRAAYYSWKGEPKTNPTDARGQWTMDFGSQIEKMYTEHFKQLGIWAGNNIKYYDRENNISGEVDIFVFDKDSVTTLKVDGKDMPISGVEIKTAYGYGFQKNIKVFPKLENLCQVMLYMHDFKMYSWILIYHARDTQEQVEYRIGYVLDKDHGAYCTVNGVPVKSFYLNDILDRYKQLGDFLNLNMLPPRDFTYCYSLEKTIARQKAGEISATRLRDVKSKKCTDSDWQCLYCSYLNKCWEEKRKEVLSG